MLKFSSKYPFVRIVRVPKPEDFDTFIKNNAELSLQEKILVKGARDLLFSNNIPLNKVRFVFDRNFEYDVDTDTVNPKYTILKPKKAWRNVHTIEIDKPENLMTISLGLYQTDHDDFDNVRKIIKRSKRGVVIKLDRVDKYDGLNYSFLMANLDNAVKFFEENK